MEATQNQGNPVWDKRRWREAAYWEEAWREEWRLSLYGRQQPARSGREWWDRRAEDFIIRSGNEAWRQRHDQVIEIFDRSGFIQPDVEVLDIGCGPGFYTLPLAGRVKRVVALDPSAQMLSLLQQRAAEAGIANIETACATWEEVDLERRGWKGRFGLVVAAMTPGVFDAETLDKMMAASNHGCYYGGLTWCDDPAQEEVWRHLFQTEMPPIPADVFYAFHLLHAWGYAPSLELRHMSTRWEMPYPKAVERMAVTMAPYLEITEEVQGEIGRAVAGMLRDGQFYQERQFMEGILTWSVRKHDER